MIIIVDTLLSVIVPAFNEENQIVSLLKSLKNQNFPLKFEIIIVNNESTDRTVEKINEFIAQNRIKNIRVINSVGKLGKVRNEGVLNSRGKWIAFIDADETADPNWLKNLAKNRKDYDIIIGTIKSMNPNVNFISKFYDLLHIDRFEALKKNLELKTFGTGNLLVNRDIFEKGIKFDDNFPTSEDGDFSYRLYKRGYRARFCEDAIIYHKIPENMRQHFYFQKKMMLGRLLIFLKHRDYNSFIKIFRDLFFYISPNYFKIYRKNKIILKFQFILIGLNSFLISVYQCINPINLFKLRKKIVRPK